MTPTEFCYWLQGFFELRSNNDPLSTEQAKCIVRHADLVMATTQPSRDRSLIETLRALASTIDRSPASLTNTIRDLLAHQFEHVIDPKAGDAEQQAKLNALHQERPNGPKQIPGQPISRC